MKYLISTLIFILLTSICNSQQINKIDYPFSKMDKYLTEDKGHLEFNYTEDIRFSFDGKHGIWFIEKKEIHFYNIEKEKWELFDENNGRFKIGQVGVIFHDSNGSTWLGCDLAHDYDVTREYSGGVSYYNGNELKLFENHDLDMISPEISAISEGPNGEIYVATGELFGGSSEMPGGLFIYYYNQWYDYS